MQFVDRKRLGIGSASRGYDGGSSIISISTTCVPRRTAARNGLGVTGPFGPLLVTGSTNGHTYTCTATERHAYDSLHGLDVSNLFVAGAVEVTCNSSLL